MEVIVRRGAGALRSICKEMLTARQRGAFRLHTVTTPGRPERTCAVDGDTLGASYSSAPSDPNERTIHEIRSDCCSPGPRLAAPPGLCRPPWPPPDGPLEDRPP